ncbi:MAG: hypothetical protein O7F10_04445 [Deltaproteobacteria bacterium]|nr:hypothetical protein [Deltaproteobacteria bacterium]
MTNADFSEARRKERHEENQHDEIAHGLADPERGFAFASVMNLMKMGMRGTSGFNPCSVRDVARAVKQA